MGREYDRDVEGSTSFPKDFGDLPGEARRRPDDDIKGDIESILFYDDLVRSYEINVDVNQGVVTLTGAVSNEMERRRTEEDVSKVFGVHEIVNEIEISQQAGL